jgi:hypothetical protein
LGADSAIVDRRSENYSFCLFEERVQLLHVVFERALLVLEAEVTVSAEPDALAPHCPETRLKTLLLKHAQGFFEEVFGGLLPRATAYADNNHKHSSGSQYSRVHIKLSSTEDALKHLDQDLAQSALALSPNFLEAIVIAIKTKYSC